MINRCFVNFILAIVTALIVLSPVRAEDADFGRDIAGGDFTKAAALLPQFPANSPQLGQDINTICALLPLMQWTPEVANAWSDTMTAINDETNSYWGAANVGALLGALATPTVPRNAQTATIVDRAVAAAKKWPNNDGLGVAAKGLIWYGDFDKAFALYPPTQVPEPLLEFAFETLADKPELAARDDLWSLATTHIPNDPIATRKAIRALAIAGRIKEALAMAQREPDTVTQVEGEINAARYARYGGHDADFALAMDSVAKGLSTLDANSTCLPVVRDLMQEIIQPPTPVLSTTFWSTVESWATGLPGAVKPVAITEVAAAAAYIGRADPSVLLPELNGSAVEDPAKMRVACGWLWSGKRDQAVALAKTIHDSHWSALAAHEMMYLMTDQQGLSAATKTSGGEGRTDASR